MGSRSCYWSSVKMVKQPNLSPGTQSFRPSIMWLHFTSAVSKSLRSLKIHPEYRFRTTKNRSAYTMSKNKVMTSHYLGPIFLISAVNWLKPNSEAAFASIFFCHHKKKLVLHFPTNSFNPVVMLCGWTCDVLWWVERKIEQDQSFVLFLWASLDVLTNPYFHSIQIT